MGTGAAVFCSVIFFCLDGEAKVTVKGKENS